MPFSWQRVKQRKIIQWGIAYLASASLVVGVASDLAQGFAWAVILLRVLVVVLAAGFFAVLIVAWYHGEKGQQRVTATEAVLLAVVMFGAGVVGWFAASTSPPAPDRITVTPASTARVAVLPCDYPAGNPQFEFLSVGLAEQVIARLTQTAALRPVALNSVLQYRDGTKDYPRIADQLDATAILDCTIRADGSDVRVTFHLIDPRTQTEVWAQPFARRFDDLRGYDSEIALEVARGLDVKLSASEKNRMERFPQAQNQEAWFEYLRGLQLTTPMQADLHEAIRHFSNAIALDSTFAPAHAGLADALATIGWLGIIAPREARDSAKAAARRALALSDKLGEGYAALGWVEFWFDWDWMAAEADLKRGLELNPSSAKAHLNYGYFLVAMQRHDEADAQIAESVNLDPLNAFAHSHVAWALFHAGKRRAAAAGIRNTMQRFPEQAAAMALLLSWFSAANGDYREAVAAGRSAETVMHDDPWLRAVLGVVYARAGKTEEANRMLATLQTLSNRRYVDPRNLAFLHAALGDTARALDELEEAYRLGSPQLVFLRAKDFLQDPLYSSPRYQALVQKMRFPAN